MKYEELASMLDTVRRKSVSMGIPAIDVEDGMILASIAFHVASRGGRTFVDAGAGIGYSTLWIYYGVAKGCSGNCKIVALEYNGAIYKELKRNISRLQGGALESVQRVLVEAVHGDALGFLTAIDSMDYAFIDIEKGDYPKALSVLESKLSKDGVALFHNAFYPRPPQSFFNMLDRGPWRYMVAPTPQGLLIAVRE